MNSKVHSVIMKSAINLCGTKLVEELNKKIDVDRWEDYLEHTLHFDMRKDKPYKKSHVPRFHFRTYADLLIYGAYMEDQTEFESDVDDSRLTNGFFKFLVYLSGQGEHLHWLEHYWSDELQLGKGLELTADYVSQVLNEAIGVDKTFGEYFGKISEEILDLIVKPLSLIFNRSTTYESFRSAPDRALDYWNILIDQYNRGEKEAAYFNLGKVCHLLEDMCTPAHVHGDCHLGAKWIGYAIKEYLGIDLTWLITDYVDDDQYESYTGDVIEGSIPVKEVAKGEPESWADNIEEAIPERWRLTNENGFPTYDSEWEVMDYFRHAAETTRKYDSDDCDGYGSGHPYRWLHFDLISTASWKLERRWDGDLSDYACDQIATHLIPLAIGDTAGLLYKFCDAVGLPCTNDLIEMKFQVWDFTVVNDEDDHQEGEIYLTTQVNSRTPRQSGRILANSGESFNWETDDSIYYMHDQFVVHDLSTNDLEIWTDAYDNDDWDVGSWKFRSASDDLGYTHKKYKISELPAYYYEYDLESSNGDYKITYELSKKSKETSKMIGYYGYSRFQEGKSLFSNPILLNLTTMQRHCSVTSTSKPCGTWKKISTDKAMAFYMTEEELFKEEDKDVVKNIRMLGQALNGQAQNGQNQNDQTQNGQTPNGQAQNSQAQNGNSVTDPGSISHTGDGKARKMSAAPSKGAGLLKLADEIEKSSDKCVRAALERSPYKKFIRYNALDEKQFEAWNMINKDNIYDKFELSCSCCRKSYRSYLKNGKNLKGYTGEKSRWLPKKKPDEVRWKKKTEFEKLRERMYYESKNTSGWDGVSLFSVMFSKFKK